MSYQDFINIVLTVLTIGVVLSGAIGFWAIIPFPLINEPVRYL